MPQVMTRKDCIRVAESFVRSGFKGISVAPGYEGKMLAAASFMRAEERGYENEQDETSEQTQFMRRRATRQEMRDAERLATLFVDLANSRSSLSKRTLSIIHSRAFRAVPWIEIGKQYRMHRMEARRYYQDGLYVIYRVARLDQVYRLPDAA